MGTTSEKLTYLNNTKQLLKDKINNLGGDITDQTTFRQYANQLQNVYDNLPKTEYQEGTEITLSNTLKGKLDFDNGVVGIGQSEQESTQGYNLLNLKDGTYTGSGITIVVVNGKATISGTSTSLVTVPIDLNNSLSLTNNQVYSLYANNESINADVAFRPIAGDGAFQTSFSSLNNASAVTFTGSTTSITKVHIRVASGVTVNNIICKPMVVVGNDTTKSYEQYTGGQASPNPSYPQTINSVTGNQDVVVSGKNKLKNNATTSSTGGFDFTVYDDGTVKVNGTHTSTVFFTLTTNQKIAPNTTYTLSGAYSPSARLRIREYDINDTNLSEYFDSGSGVTFTSKSNVDHVNVQIVLYASQTNIMFYPQLEQGNQATPYEPYITPKTYQLSLGDIELNAIGDYKDELIYDVDEDKVYKNEKIGKSIITSTYIDGLANFLLQSINSYGIANFLLQTTYGAEQFITDLGLSNYFSKQSTIIANTQTDGILYQPRNIYIRINQNIAKTTDELRNYVDSLNTNGNPLLVYQVLATPVEKPITDTTLINQVKALYNAHSNNGTTIITSNGNLPMIIKVRGLKGE